MSKWDKYAVDETTDKWSQYSTATPGQSGQEAFQQSSQEGSWMDQLPPVQIAKQAFEGASNAFGALNPFSGEDLGQRAGKLATGVAQTLTSPLAPAVEIAKKAPGALKSGAIMGLQGLKKGVEGFQAVADAGANTGEAIRRGDIGMIGQGVKEGVYGALKSTSGVFTGASAPFAGAISGLPDFAQMPFQKIGEALEGSKEFLRSITGTTDTPEGDAIGDSIDVALGLLPLLPKAKVTTVTNKLTNSFTSPKAMMSELNGELRQSPKLAERNYNTQSFYTNISKNGFFDEYATSLVKKVGESIKELPNRLGTYVERYAEKGKGTVLDEAVADMNAVHGEVYKNLGKSIGNQSAIIENSLPIFDSIEGIARSNLGKSPIVKKLLDIRQVLDNNGSIQDLVNARTTIEDMLSKPKDKFTSTNTQLLAKLHDSIGSDLQSTMRAIGGEMSSVADDLASSTSTFRETMNTFFSDTAPTVEALPKSAQGLGMLDDTIRGNAQKSLLKGHVGTDPLKNLGNIDKSEIFNVLDDVQKAEMQRYSTLKSLDLPSPQKVAEMMGGAIYKNVPLSAREAAQTYTSSADQLVKGLKNGSATVQQVASKLELPTGEIRSLQKYAGNQGMLRQLRIAEQNLGRPQVGMPTPRRVPADEIIAAGKYLEKDIGITSGKKVGAISKASLDKVDFTAPKTVLTKQISELGGKVNSKGKISYSDTSPLAGQNSLQTLLEDAYNMSTKKKSMRTVADAEQMSKSLFDRLDAIDAGALKVSRPKAQVAQALTKFKQAIATELDAKIPGYKQANMDIAKNISVLDPLYKKLGIKDIYTGLTDKTLKMEEFSKGLLSNTAADRITLVGDILDRAIARGFNGNKAEILRQIEFADLLDDITGTTKPTGFAGEIQKAGRQLFTGGIKSGIVDAALTKLARLPGSKEKLSALRQLLENKK